MQDIAKEDQTRLDSIRASQKTVAAEIEGVTVVKSSDLTASGDMHPLLSEVQQIGARVAERLPLRRLRLVGK